MKHLKRSGAHEKIFAAEFLSVYRKDNGFYIYGDSGNDYLNGEWGDDTLTGGSVGRYICPFV